MFQDALLYCELKMAVNKPCNPSNSTECLFLSKILSTAEQRHQDSMRSSTAMCPQQRLILVTTVRSPIKVGAVGPLGPQARPSYVFKYDNKVAEKLLHLRANVETGNSSHSYMIEYSFVFSKQVGF